MKGCDVLLWDGGEAKNWLHTEGWAARCPPKLGENCLHLFVVSSKRIPEHSLTQCDIL